MYLLTSNSVMKYPSYISLDETSHGPCSDLRMEHPFIVEGMQNMLKCGGIHGINITERWVYLISTDSCK